MSTPYIGFSNDNLAKLPKVKAGDEFNCPRCEGRHTLLPANADDGEEICLFYKCGGTAYLGALDGRLIAGQKSDVSGEL